MKLFAGAKCEFLEVIKYLGVNWKSSVIIFVPLVFLPLALAEEKEAKCGYTVCVMGLFWMTEAIPIAVTALIPVVLFPLLGVLSTQQVCSAYFRETTVMFIGSMIMAIATEHCNLHKRIALRIMLLLGTSPRRLMLSFMITTMFLSMWICNAAATAMMTPIVIAVLDVFKMDDKISSDETLTESGAAIGNDGKKVTVGWGSAKRLKDNERRPNKEEICYFLGVAYAANIGGTGTITGTATNLIFKGIFESLFPDADGLNFATWMEFNIPLMILNTLLAWLWLQIFYMGLLRKKDGREESETEEKTARERIERSYDELGPITYHEINVLCLFVIDILLWFFRKPEFVAGWWTFFPDKTVKDATPAVAVAILLFILPANLEFLQFRTANRKEIPTLLNWKTLQNKMPFDIILLFGGGFAIAEASETSGLSIYMGQRFEVFSRLPKVLLLVVIVLATSLATEIASNTAVANILLPVLARMSRIIRLHPLFMMMPAAVSCSYAFMLPVATPPNAIVVAASNMKVTDMMRAGLVMNLICITTLTITFLYIGVPVYGIGSFPKWAEMNQNITDNI